MCVEINKTCFVIADHCVSLPTHLVAMASSSLGLRCGESFSFSSSCSSRCNKGVDEISCFPRSLKQQRPPLKPYQITSRSCAGNTISPPYPTPTTSTSLNCSFCIESCFGEQQNHKKKNLSPEKLDEWMMVSVSEIVRNIGEAPFLAHVYSKKTNPAAAKATRLELEKEKDSWPDIRRRWKEGCPVPDGVILVEQLDQQPPTTGTRAWGVLIQGRGVETAACYILKTCRVWSSLGFCTHFFLVKAKCFGESAELQLQNSWNGIDN